MARTVQIRELDDEVYTVLRTRAAAEDLSLSQYLRRELTRVAAVPTMAELLERADRRRAEGGGAAAGALAEALEADRVDHR
jgi:antitoxin FitA